MKIKTKVLVKRMTAIFLCGVFAVSQPPAAAMAASEMAAPETGAAGEQLLFIQTMEDFQDFQKKLCGGYVFRRTDRQPGNRPGF